MTGSQGEICVKCHNNNPSLPPWLMSGYPLSFRILFIFPVNFHSFSQMGSDADGFYRMTAANAKREYIDWGVWMPPSYLNVFSFSSQPLLLNDLFWFYNLSLYFVCFRLHFFVALVLVQNKPFTLSDNDNPILCNDQQLRKSQTITQHKPSM